MDLKMTEANDFYKEIDNERRAVLFSETIGIELEHAKNISRSISLYPWHSSPDSNKKINVQ